MREDQLPAPQPHACSVLSRQLDEPVAGTAVVAGAWLLIEQPGPWGRTAVTHSRLDPGLGAELEERTAGAGVRLALIRRTEDHHDAAPRHRRWFAASTHPRRTWLATGVVEDPADLLKIDFAALDAGDLRAVADLEHTVPDGAPLLGVCTNGKRDACCATAGRQVAVAAAELDAASGPGGAGSHPSVWEITHLGGHRFAPTAVVLPSGYSYGRLDAAAASRVLAGARRGRMTVDGCRGRSTWPRAGQVAELAVRSALSETADTGSRRPRWFCRPGTPTAGWTRRRPAGCWLARGADG